MRMRSLSLFLCLSVGCGTLSGNTAATAALNCAKVVIPPATKAAVGDAISGPAATWEQELTRWLPTLGQAGLCAVQAFTGGAAPAAAPAPATTHTASASAEGTADASCRGNAPCLKERAAALLAKLKR